MNFKLNNSLRIRLLSNDLWINQIKEWISKGDEETINDSEESRRHFVENNAYSILMRRTRAKGKNLQAKIIHKAFQRLLFNAIESNDEWMIYVFWIFWMIKPTNAIEIE